MKKKITIVDYGSGNLLSAQQSFIKVVNLIGVDAEIQISNKPENLKRSSHIVLPGQGAFKTCMDGIKKIPGMEDQLNEFVKVEQKPFFGICVGMQLLAENSQENGNHKGLGWIGGTIKKLPSDDTKLPHMGWNNISFKKSHHIFSNIKDKSFFYFVHSYFVDPINESEILSTTNYGYTFASGVFRDNIVALQFHPEKSSSDGLKVLKNFITWDIS